MMIDEVKIRSAKPKDLASISGLWKEFMDFHKTCNQQFTRASDGHKKYVHFVTEQIEKITSCVLVAEWENKIVGYCVATISRYPPVFDRREFGYISDLAVSEVWRRRGIGKKIVEEIQNWFLEREIHRFEVRVLTTNDLSTSFWRKMDFLPYAEILHKTA